MSNKKHEELQPIESIHLEHELIIDEYFKNGFKGYQAVLEHRPDLTEASARVLFSTLAKQHRDYIDKKRQELQANSNLMLEQMVREAAIHYFSDATKYLGLTDDELKLLPPEERRAIQKIKTTTRTYTDRSGKEITEKICDVSIVAKNTSGDMLNKLLGNYALDNKQKKIEINYDNLSAETIKELISATKKEKQ